MFVSYRSFIWSHMLYSLFSFRYNSRADFKLRSNYEYCWRGEYTLRKYAWCVITRFSIAIYVNRKRSQGFSAVLWGKTNSVCIWFFEEWNWEPPLSLPLNYTIYDWKSCCLRLILHTLKIKTLMSVNGPFPEIYKIIRGVIEYSSISFLSAPS